nr:hypothetical protein [Tanacetum cinerariifolium]
IKLGLGFKVYIRLDEVCDLSTPNVFDPDPENGEVESLYEKFVKAGSMHEVPPPIIGTFMPTSYKSDLEETQPIFGSKSNTSSINTFDSNDCVFCDNNDKSSASKTNSFASCVSSPKTNDSFSTVDVKILPNKSHLIKDCDVYDTVDNFPSVVSKAAFVPAGSRNSSAYIHAGRSIPAASRNRQASIHAGRSIPAASRNRPASIHAGRHIHAGSWNKLAPFPVGRSVPTGWTNHAARPFFRPTNLYFDNISWPEIYDHMSMNEGRWGFAVKSSAGYSWRYNKPYMQWRDDGVLLLSPQQVVLGDITNLICNGGPRTMVDLTNLHGFALHNPQGRLKSKMTSVSHVY